jgi:hypothetical protein
MIDDTILLAWIDGELDEAEAARVAAAVAADPALAKKAQAHRMLRRRLDTAFRPLLDEVAHMPPRRAATVLNFEEARKARVKDKPPARPAVALKLGEGWKRWMPIAASLLLGVAVGAQLDTGGNVAERDGAMVADGALAYALDRKLSGQEGRVRIALSFRDKAGDYCRSFDAGRMAGVACRSGDAWQMRAATSRPITVPQGDYRMAAAGDPVILSAVEGMIAGDPLDAAGERTALSRGWRGR